MSKESLLEAIKEATRLVLLALVSYILTEGLIDVAVEYVLGAKLDTASKAQVIALLTTGLRSIDKYLHEVGKLSKNALLSGGLTRF